MGEPLITVIIPAKNEEQYISSCLTAVLSQTLAPDCYRIVVVDNGSTDSTVAMVTPFLSTGRVQLVSKAGGTIASVRNSGAALATGAYVAFLDADCVPAPDWLERGTELLQDDADSGCIGFVGAPPEATAPWVEETWQHLCSTGRAKGTRAVPWLSSFNLVLRRELFCRVGGFDETLETCEDADLGYRLSRHAKLLLSDLTSVRHLDEPKTLRQFFFKEMWRGQSTLRNFFRSERKRDDFLSVAAPICYLLVLVLWTVAAVAQRVAGSELTLHVGRVCLLVVLLAPLLNVYYKTRRVLNLSETAKAFFLSAVYLVARGLVVIPYGRR